MSKIKKIIHDNEEKYIRFLAKLVAFISSCQHILANPSPITFENKLFFMIGMACEVFRKSGMRD